MAIGKQPYQRTSQIQYVGLSAWLANRLSNHNTLPKITKDLKLWLGAASTAEPAGKKKKTTTATLDYAEWLHAYFMKLPLNSKKTCKPPPMPVTVLNRWWKKDYETPWIKRPDPAWPDLIDFLGSTYAAKLVWFGGRMKRVKSPFNNIL